MAIRDDLQNAMKQALRDKDQSRLETLRMAKGALLMKEKEGKGELTDEVATAALRAEVKKRQQSVETYRELGKEDAAKAVEQEIAVIEEFLPKQLSRDQIEERVRAYLEDHPEIDHPGKLTGAMKKELGDAADGKLLNEICRAVLA